MNNVSVILNPKAGKGKALKFKSKLNKVLKQNGLNVDYYETKRRKHATEITKEISKSSDTIIVMGGDGTLSEVVNGVNPFEESIPKILVLPLGSGNDFAKEINHKKDSAEILRDFLSEKCIEKSVNLSKVKIVEEGGEEVNFYFINALGIGFDSFVAYLNLENKILSGVPSYVVAVFKAIKKYDPIEPNITVDGKPHSNDSRKLLITIGNNKTSGGGFYLNPYAEIDDNLLDITVIQHLSPIGIVKKLPKVLINKTETIPEFVHKRGRSFSVQLKNPFIVHADGEIFSDKASKIKVDLLEERLLFWST